MQAVKNGVEIQRSTSHVFNIPDASEKSDRMLRIDSLVAQSWYLLGVALASAAVLARVVTIVFPSTLTFTILAVSLVALSLLATKVAVKCLEPYLSPEMKELADWVQAILGDLLLGIGDLFFQPFYICKKKFFNKTEEVDGDTDYIVIHGYNGQKAITEAYLAHRAAMDQIGPMHSVNLGSSLFLGIDDHVEKVYKCIQKLAKKNPHRKRVLVGHSMGGLVAQELLIKHRNLNITKVVTLGTPSEGTLFARLAAMINPFDKCAPEMRPDSERMERLKKKINEIKDVQFMHVYSKNDPIIPVDSAKFGSHHGDNVQTLEVSGVGHSGILFCDKAIDGVFVFLRDQKIPRTDSTECLNIVAEAG